MLQTSSICVARSADQRLQVWANAYDVAGADNLLYTRWGSGKGTGWTPWQPFLTDGLPVGEPLYYTWAAQLALPIPTPFGRSGGDGRMEVWELVSQAAPIFKVAKSSIEVNAPWSFPWTNFRPPPSVAQGGYKQITSVGLSDGRLQLFVVDQSNTIWTTVKTGIVWDASWSLWSQFLTQGAPNGGLFNLTAARLLDGSVTLWGIAAGGSVWAISRSASSTSSEYLQPNAGWGSWTEFPLGVGGSDLSPPAALTNVTGILAATGSTFSYFWAYGVAEGTSSAQWYLVWTVIPWPSPGSSPPSWENLSYGFFVPPSMDSNFTSLAVAILPDGGLQLFALEIGKLGSNGYPEYTKIATAWQLLGGQFPMEWSFNNGTPWEDFSLT
jgi:hypothetical protein